MDDNDIRIFIEKQFGQEWLDIFDNCPIGVMRSDIWRYLVVYTYGGIYCDLDTICQKPINEWIPKKYSVVISKDDDGINYNQLTFASVPQHKLLNAVIEKVKKEFLNIKYTDQAFVDKMTGVKVWTKAINEYFSNNTIDDIFCYSQESIVFLEDRVVSYFNEGFRHLTASINWNDGKYIQWQKEELKYIREKNA